MISLKGNLHTIKSHIVKRLWTVVGGEIEYEDDEVKIVVKGVPKWKTDFGTIFFLITWITFGWIKPTSRKLVRGFLLHDALWQCRSMYDGMYSMEWTNDKMENCHKHDGAGSLKCKSIQVGVSSYFAKRKWNNPSDDVESWVGEIVEITWKGK